MTDLVLLHGGNHGSWCWEHFVEALNQQPGCFDRVITLDMPGCGKKRGRDVASLRLDDVVNELNEDLHALGVNQAVLLGHSIAGGGRAANDGGGRSATIFAAGLPGLRIAQ